MKRKRKGEGETPPDPGHAESPAPATADIVSANYLISQPYGGGLLSSPKRYQLYQDEHDAIGVLVQAANEIPVLRAIAQWAEANGAPESLLEALASARNWAQWAIEGRQQPEGWKPYRTHSPAGADSTTNPT